MSTVFYAHLVPLDDVLQLLHKYELLDEERTQMEHYIHSMFDHRVMEIVLYHLPLEHHDELLRRVADDPTNLEIIIFIKHHVPDIDEHIQAMGKYLALELKGLLHETSSREE